MSCGYLPRTEEQTFCRWKKQYGGLEASEVRELKQLREENLNGWWLN